MWLSSISGTLTGNVQDMCEVKQTEQAGGREEEEQQHCVGVTFGKLAVLSGFHPLPHGKPDISQCLMWWVMLVWLYYRRACEAHDASTKTFSCFNFSLNTASMTQRAKQIDGICWFPFCFHYSFAPSHIVDNLNKAILELQVNVLLCLCVGKRQSEETGPCSLLTFSLIHRPQITVTSR